MITYFKNGIYSGNRPNVNAIYGIFNNEQQGYASIEQAIDYITNKEYITLQVGMTIVINENGKLVEYWNPENPQTFVVKQSGGSGSDLPLSIKDGLLCISYQET